MSRTAGLMALGLTFAFLASCKTGKEISREIEIIRKADEVYDSSRHTNLDFDNLSLRATVSIRSSKQKISFSSIIRMKRDSSIWVSVTFLGIAGAKALLTPDSIFMLNYRDKTYATEDYSRVQDLLNAELLTLPALQDLLLGNMIELDDFEKLHLKMEDSKYLLATMSDRKIDKDWVGKKKERFEKRKDRLDDKRPEKVEKRLNRRPVRYEDQTVEYRIDPVRLKIEQINIRDYSLKGRVETIYSDFRPLEDKYVPYHVRLLLSAEEDLEIEIVYSKIAREEDLKMPISIPEKYERIRL